jgi:hypothetical protein
MTTYIRMTRIYERFSNKYDGEIWGGFVARIGIILKIRGQMVVVRGKWEKGRWEVGAYDNLHSDYANLLAFFQ